MRKSQGESFVPVVVSWDDVRQEIKEINALLFDIIEQFNPSKKLRLYRMRYPYGAKIVDAGQFNCYSLQGKLLPLGHEDIPLQMRQDLNYRSIPLAILMHNSAEVFIANDERIVPMRLFSPGEFFGVFEIIDPPNEEGTASVTNVSSGARSAFMLPKISDSLCHKKLANALGLQSPLPNGLADHGVIFAEIGQHPDFINKWHSEILVFSRDWFTERKDNAGWVRFSKSLYEIGWMQSQYWRNQTTFGLLWKTFIEAIRRKNIRPRPYLVDTIKHLLFVSSGAIPGFSASKINPLALPVDVIQDLYLHAYGLKSHYPLIMIPHHFSRCQEKISVYYSLSYPTLLDASLNPKQAPTIIEDLRDLKQLWMLLSNERDANITLRNMVKDVCFDFYTCEQDPQQKIDSSAELPLVDKMLTGMQHGSNRTFPHTSPFLRGCIRISTKL